MSTPAGHETPEERSAMEQAFTRLTRAQGAAGSTGERIAQIIRDRRARRRDTEPSDTTHEEN